jgi:hypothetical protein
MAHNFDQLLDRVIRAGRIPVGGVAFDQRQAPQTPPAQPPQPPQNPFLQPAQQNPFAPPPQQQPRPPEDSSAQPPQRPDQDPFGELLG